MEEEGQIVQIQTVNLLNYIFKHLHIYNISILQVDKQEVAQTSYKL